MFRFGSPDFLYLLALVPLIIGLFVYGYRRKRTAMRQFGSLELVRKLSPTASPTRQLTKNAILVTALLLCFLSLASPQYGTRVETVKRTGQDIFVAVDVSTSMLAEDIRPSRLEKAKREVGDLINRLEGDRIGLIAFAGEAFLVCPLTLDYGAAKLFLSALDSELIPSAGTALAEAIEKALDSFGDQERRNKVLIAITDGEDHDGRVEEVARKAAQKGVIIYAIGIGTPQGVPIPIYDEEGRRQGFKRDESGEVVLTRLDESTLEEIARETSGEYYRVTADASELDQIYSAVAGMDKQELAARRITLFDEKFQFVAGTALILLAIEFLLGESRSIAGTWKGRFQ